MDNYISLQNFSDNPENTIGRLDIYKKFNIIFKLILLVLLIIVTIFLFIVTFDLKNKASTTMDNINRLTNSTGEILYQHNHTISKLEDKTLELENYVHIILIQYNETVTFVLNNFATPTVIQRVVNITENLENITKHLNITSIQNDIHLIACDIDKLLGGHHDNC